MKYTLSKTILVFGVLAIILYGMGLLSILTQNEGRKLSKDYEIKDYGFNLMKEIDTNDGYLKEEMVDYRLDEVSILLIIVYGLIMNFCYNQHKRYKFMIEWFVLLSILYMLRTLGMFLTIIPAPKNDIGTCRINYEFESNADLFLDAIKIYVYRNRVCYDLVFEADLINSTIVSLLLLKYFPTWSVRVKVAFLWLLNVFVVMMMRMTYTVNVYLSILVSCLLFMIFYYETSYNVGMFGMMLKEEDEELVDVDSNVAVDDDIEMEHQMEDNVEVSVVSMEEEYVEELGVVEKLEVKEDEDDIESGLELVMR